jgi:hypothetical protein
MSRRGLIERGRPGLRAELIQPHHPYLEVLQVLRALLQLLGFLKGL